MLYFLLKLICEKEKICMTHHFLDFAHGDQLSWVKCSQVGRLRAAPELMVTPSLPAAGLRVSTFCPIKLRKKTVYNLSHVLYPWHSFSPGAFYMSFSFKPTEHIQCLSSNLHLSHLPLCPEWFNCFWFSTPLWSRYLDHLTPSSLCKYHWLPFAPEKIKS